jgi:Ca2+-binding RTX toxin-like protein
VVRPEAIPLPREREKGDHVRFGKTAGGLVIAIVATSSIVLGNPSAADAVQKCFGKKATIVGSKKSETINGTPKPDVIVALAGNDRIQGKNGSDRICAGDGDDYVGARSGFDKIDGDDGDDEIHGGGQHQPTPDDGDTMRGGAGDDFLDGRRGELKDKSFGEAGNDTLLGNEVADGGPGNDLIEMEGYITDAKPDTAQGGPGNDRIYGDFGGSPNELRGGSGLDQLFGTQANDMLFGEDDDDLLEGRGGNDTLDGGNGNDTCLQPMGTATKVSCEV